jgi:hypothetical protein
VEPSAVVTVLVTTAAGAAVTWVSGGLVGWGREMEQEWTGAS